MMLIRVMLIRMMLIRVMLIRVMFGTVILLSTASALAETEHGSPMRFAIIGDLTGGERPGVFSAAMRGVSALQPDFLLSVGDMIEGGTQSEAQLNKEWRSFQQRLGGYQDRFYPLVGNHDISNPTQRLWWLETIGPRYYHVRKDQALFLMLDSEDYTEQRFDEIARIRDESIAVYRRNKDDFEKTAYAQLPERKFGLMAQAQIDYFATVLADNKDAAWVFVLMHKPLWKDPSFSGFDQLLQRLPSAKTTAFSGHEHRYQYQQLAGIDYIGLGTTGGGMNPEAEGSLDHILWVSFDQVPQYMNIDIHGLVDKTGARVLPH